MTKQEIIKEIKENHLNDVDFLCEIIEEGTDYWEPMVEVVQRVGKDLVEADEMSPVIDFEED